MSSMTAALQKICDHHKFNVTGLQPNEVHAIAYEALETSKGTFHAHAIATQLAQAAEALHGEKFVVAADLLTKGSQAIFDMIDVADRAAHQHDAMVARLKAESVTSIILQVVPDEHGMALEVPAKTTDQVVDLLTSMGEKIVELEQQLEQMRAQAVSERGTTAQEPDAWLYREKNIDHRGKQTEWGPWSLCKPREAKQMQALDGFEVQPFFANAPIGHISIQEAWEACGGNPGIKATREELIQALTQLDRICDEADLANDGGSAPRP